MKKKTFNKKLALSKETIAHLNNSEMHGIAGGTAQPTPSNGGPCPLLTQYNCTPLTLCGWITSCYTCVYPICP